MALYGKERLMNIQNKLIINAVIKKKFLGNKIDYSTILAAEQNRVLFAFSKHSSLVDISKKLEDTLFFIEEVLKNVPHLTTRTYKYIHYVTFDVDLFVNDKDYSKVIKLFKAVGCQIVSHDSSFGGRLPNMQKNVLKNGLLTIDLHRDFTWQKRRFLDVNLMFKNTRKRKIAGVIVEIPSPEVEFLLCMADIGHERFNFTQLDLIWLKGLSKEIKDWNLIINSVEKYGWFRTFSYLCKLINGSSCQVYKEEIIPGFGQLKGQLNLPYFLPLRICWLSYLENLIHNKRFSVTSLAYMHYMKLRYYLSGKKRMPYYNSWYKI